VDTEYRRSKRADAKEVGTKKLYTIIKAII